MFTNMLPTIEQHSGWVVNTLVHMRANKLTQCLTDQGAESAWMQHAKDRKTRVRSFCVVPTREKINCNY